MAIDHVKTADFDAAISEGTVLVDFWATWCGPCRMQAPILDELDKTLEGKVKILKVDVDEEPALAQRFGVMSIPTLAVFKNGELTAKEVGVHTADQLVTLIG